MLRNSMAVRGCARAPLFAAMLLLAWATDCAAIEMFTYFYDGSRIGLPNLEVPVEAYPGIPLRSDRIRARRRAMRGEPIPVGQPRQSGGMTIRVMPALPAPAPPVPAAPADAKAKPARRPAQP
ncbi:MAG: hypothetical protein EBR23_10995 [Planctomycetia bacterium]|nr:hypothetical protein [Planctomycetia bacterium]